MVVGLASRFRSRTNTFAEPVSVLIAAYNEGKVIAETLRSVLASEYGAELEVTVIDDGSNDNTAAEVEKIARQDPRVRLLRQSNSGKASALRRGLSAARHEIITFLDADTHVQPDTLRYLTQPFADARVGAVSGHAKVGNLRSFIARCQALEYTCGFNLDRRAYTRWNCVTVVPGAIGAARKAAIADAGWLSLDTLAEDTDLTLSLHRKGYRVEYAPGRRSPGRKRRKPCARSGAAAFPLGLRHVAMSLETSRSYFQLALSRARLVQSAERLVFPNHPRRDFSAGRFSPHRFVTVWHLGRRPALRHYFSRDRSFHRGPGLFDRGRAGYSRMAHFADAPDLPAAS